MLQRSPEDGACNAPEVGVSIPAPEGADPGRKAFAPASWTFSGAAKETTMLFMDPSGRGTAARRRSG
jgi:hypothetical protein